MFRGDRDAVAELGRARATSSSSTRTSATAAPCTQAMKGCCQGHPRRRRVDQQEPGRPVRVDRHQHGRQPQRVRGRGRPRRGPARLLLLAPRSTATPRSCRCTRTTSSRPLTPYCISKRAGEDLLGFYERRSGLSWIALRFFNVYGPGQKTTAYYTSVINHFVNRIEQRRGRRSSTARASSRWTSSTSTTSRARSCWRSTREQANVPVNIGTGIDTSIADLARILIDAVGADVEPHLQPARRPRQPPRRRHHPRQGGARLRGEHQGRGRHERPDPQVG